MSTYTQLLGKAVLYRSEYYDHSKAIDQPNINPVGVALAHTAGWNINTHGYQCRPVFRTVEE
jgi:hypothetical protein